MLNYKSLNAVTLVGRIGSLDMRSSSNGNKFLTCSVVTESSVTKPFGTTLRFLAMLKK